MSSTRRISPLERQRRIVARVAAGSVGVDTLAKELGISEISVRRDLVTLEKQGKLLRVYSGAISNEKVAFEFSFKDKESRNRPGKVAVAPTRILSMPEMAAMLAAVTGWETSDYEIMRIGERRNHLMRCYNLREGLTAQDDTLPDRFFEEPIASGPR